MLNHSNSKGMRCCLFLAALTAFTQPASAQAPFPGAVEVCVNGTRGWVPADHPLRVARCAPEGPLDNRTSTGGDSAEIFPSTTLPPPPGGIGSKPLELGRFYMGPYGDVGLVIAVVRPTLTPGTYWLLESLGPRLCGTLSYWAVDRPRGEGYWQEITDWVSPCPVGGPAQHVP